MGSNVGKLKSCPIPAWKTVKIISSKTKVGLSAKYFSISVLETSSASLNNFDKSLSLYEYSLIVLESL